MKKECFNITVFHVFIDTVFYNKINVAKTDKKSYHNIKTVLRSYIAFSYYAMNLKFS